MAALEAYQQARSRLAGNDEAAFWSAILLADAGRVDEAKSMFEDIASREPGWRDLLRRLPAAGMLKHGDVTVSSLLGS